MRLTPHEKVIVTCAMKYMDTPPLLDGRDLSLDAMSDTDIDDMLYCISLLPLQARERGYTGYEQTARACDRLIGVIESNRPCRDTQVAYVEYDLQEAGREVALWRMGY